MTTKTDWDLYYDKPFPAARYTRKLMGNILVRLIKRFGERTAPCITELGGANSCFYELIKNELKPARYIIIDNNEMGLKKMYEKTDKNTILHHADIMEFETELKADIVLSVGLIEHFPKELLEKAIDAHFKLVKESGIVIITFPSPTFLYKFTRACSEFLGLWIFHDETPLRIDDVLKMVATKGTVLYRAIIWRIILTQGVVVVQKP